MDRILLIGTGGTIACVRGDNIHLDENFKILDYVSYDDGEVEFECASPYSILSENTDFDNWQCLLDFIGNVDFGKYKGVIILHGSDTLSFTGSLVANAFYDKPIVLVASDKPLEDISANGFENFKKAVEYIRNGIDRVYISYDKIYRVEHKPPLDSPRFCKKNILVISPYVSIDYDNYSLDKVDIVLHSMYHSATSPQRVLTFVNRCKERGIPFYFVSENPTADYESSKDFENIILSSTIESAYARLLLG